jgi:hypothetical protein
MPVERILEITGGQRVVLVADLEEPPVPHATHHLELGKPGSAN